jgi:hypothetical protein
MAKSARAYGDRVGDLAMVNVTTGGYFVQPTDDGDFAYLEAVLNSEFASIWWTTRATPHAGGYFGLTQLAIKLLPVPRPDSLAPELLDRLRSHRFLPNADPFEQVLAALPPEDLEAIDLDLARYVQRIRLRAVDSRP